MIHYFMGITLSLFCMAPVVFFLGRRQQLRKRKVRFSEVKQLRARLKLREKDVDSFAELNSSLLDEVAALRVENAILSNRTAIEQDLTEKFRDRVKELETHIKQYRISPRETKAEKK